MKRTTIGMHVIWACIAGGAWLAGTRNPPEAGSAAAVSHRGAPVELSGKSAARERAGARPDPPAAGSSAEWLEAWRGPDGRISPDRLSAGVLAALRDPDPVRGLRNFTLLLEHLNAENAPAAMEALKTHGGVSDSSAWLQILCTAWGSKDGPSALAAINERSGRDAAMAAWAAANPHEAQAWLGAQPPPAPKKNGREDQDLRDLQRSLVIGMARLDADAAVRYAASQEEHARGDLAKALAREMFRRGGTEAGQWAANLTDSTMRGAALEMVARKYMADGPAEGAAWAAQNATAPDMRAAVGRVADRIAERDVHEAYSWTQLLPAGPGQDEAYQQVFSEWARQDPAASSQELLRMTPGHSRDMAIHAVAGSLVRENPEGALEWTAAISDPARQLDTRIAVARKWRATDPDAAGAWIAANLPVIVRSRAMQPD